MARKSLLLVLLTWVMVYAHAKESIARYTLPNQLKLIVAERHLSPVAWVMISYNVGGCYEPKHLAGISHILEHMMFQSAETFKKGEFSRRIASMGGELNGQTYADKTIYYEEIPAASLPKVLAMEAERMHLLKIDDKEFATEMKVIKEEFRLRVVDDVFGKLYTTYADKLYGKHPYHQPVIGYRTTLDSITAQDARKWYHQWYVPNNATITIVGDVSPEQVYNEVKEKFGRLDSRPLPPAPQSGDTFFKRSGQPVFYAEKGSPYLLAGFLVPSITSSNANDDIFALQLLANILASGESSRLYSRLVQNKKMLTDVSAQYRPYSLLDTDFTIVMLPAKGQREDIVIHAMLAELRELQMRKVPKDELERVKNKFIADLVFSSDSLEAYASLLDILSTFHARENNISDIRTRILNITPEKIQAVAQKYFNTRLSNEKPLLGVLYAKHA